MKIIYFIIIILVVIIAVFHLFPQINYRDMPKALCEAKFDNDKPNWVSSLVETDNPHYIKPFHSVDLKKLSQCISDHFSMVTIREVSENRLLAYRTSFVFNFVDWFCIEANGQVTSSATMGYYDLGKNRELVEDIRNVCL